MSFFVPNGPIIPSSGNFSSLSINGLSVTNGTIYLTVGNIVYKWPTIPPPNNTYVLGIDSSSTVNGITTYDLGWVEGASICFHASSKVLLESGPWISMERLKYGDKILTINKDNQFVYSPVVDFTGVFPFTVGSFIRVFHQRGNPLTLSEIHLVYSNGKFVMAKDLQVGMKLRVYTNSSVSELSEITRIETGTERGWYSPLTKTGTIVVDGVVASCHTSGPQSMVRFMYKPLYWYLYFFPNKEGTLPVETNHWYSIGFRRGPIGKFVEKCLKVFKWE